VTDSSPCERVRELAPDLAQDLPLELRQHAAECEDCAPLVEGARSLRADLDAWAAPEPPADLIERTLARLALAGASAAPEPADTTPARTATAEAGGRVIPLPTPAGRRSSVEILTSSTLPGDYSDATQPLSRGRLMWRLTVQAAAAVVLVGVCTAFTSVYYPAVVHAWEDRDVDRCQERLRHLGQEVQRYREEHPNSPTLRGPELRRALIEGGYADVSDFECPSERGRELGSLSYLGHLPGSDEALPDEAERPVLWDRFGNHPYAFNVVYANGHVQTVDVNDLSRWRLHREDDPSQD
jgi:hypothetical protein